MTGLCRQSRYCFYASSRCTFSFGHGIPVQLDLGGLPRDTAMNSSLIDSCADTVKVNCDPLI